MEACASAHHSGRVLLRLGHTVRLMAPQFVKPYVKTNKNDVADAEVICEAASRPNMRFVPINVWLTNLLNRRHPNIAAAALANVETSDGRNAAPLPSEMAQVIEMAERVGAQPSGKSLNNPQIKISGRSDTPSDTPRALALGIFAGRPRIALHAGQCTSRPGSVPLGRTPDFASLDHACRRGPDPAGCTNKMTSIFWAGSEGVGL